MARLILVSKSPRRRKILKDEGIKFISTSIETSEFFDKNLSLNNALKAISRSKVEAFLKENNDLNFSGKLILGCDTLVCIDSMVLGKPDDRNVAYQYLSLMSGRSHHVKTAISILDFDQSIWVEHVETSEVIMKQLSEEMIQDYISTDEPYDKAGGYAIQGIGGSLVDSYKGSWKNIVGFPIESFLKIVDESNWDLR